ncbi:MAG: alpha-ketoacid dehydrogenase subunit beta [Sedimentibacter sp.]
MTRVINGARAINEALKEEMARDKSIIYYGEDIKVIGGLYGTTKDLVEMFGEERCFEFPISEMALVGSGVGAAISGMHPVIDLMYADFFQNAMDEIWGKMAKWRYMHGGRVNVPMVLRMPTGLAGGSGPEHSQCPEALFLGCPGVKIVVPSSVYDIKGLLKTALKDQNPVLFFESKNMYFAEGEVPEEEYYIPFGVADVKRKGDDVTIVATGEMVKKSLDAANALSNEGIDVEVIDPRTLYPLDKDTILESVRKTGRLVTVYQAPKTGGFGSEIAAIVSEEALFDLKAPIKRVAGEDVPVPAHVVLEQMTIPQVKDIINGIKEVMNY